jgi:hypothetical protein
MAFLISHRGNITSMQPDRENSIKYIEEAIEQGFNVMVDIWVIGKTNLALGYNRPQHQVTLEFLKQNNIICNARSINTLNILIDNNVHCFYDTNEGISMTSGGLIWTTSDHSVVPRSIYFLPERCLVNVGEAAHIVCAGVCSDRIQEVKDERQKMILNSTSEVVS